ncbi:MAG: sulfur carrier protein ThiS [Candidatus Omnitrophota bacterium]
MRVCLNGKEMDVAAGTSLSDFLKTMKIDGQRVVVEYNGRILAASRLWEAVCLTENDRVELLSFVGGG